MLNEKVSTTMELSPEDFMSTTQAIRGEVGKVIVGQERLIKNVLITLIAGGNALLEGVPGLGKTMLVRTLAQTISCKFSRIQFTPDLMPADITGTNIVMEDDTGRKQFQFEPGPLFANLVLADEINRATPKTQSAMLEAMQEHSVTVSKVTHSLPEPFFVLATQNPIEMEGTYPLPEAQLDRFLFKIEVPYPSVDELKEIANRTTSSVVPQAESVADSEKIRAMQELARGVPIAPHVTKYAAMLVKATHPDDPSSPDEIKDTIRYGASPRGVQALILAGKILALMDDRYNVAFEDLRASAFPALRHRLILNFQAQADGISPDDVISSLLEKVTPEKVVSE